jgi:CheY-like chemotaxis protein
VKTPLMTAVLVELAKHTPSIIWGGLALLVVWLFRQPLGTQLERLASVKGGGFELGFAEAKLASAAADANRNNLLLESTVPKRHVQVTKADRERVLRRAERCREVLKDKRILWIDDQVTNNRKERELLEVFDLKLEQVQSNAAAEVALAPDGGGYDLILSDIVRPEGEPTGLDFLAAHRHRPAEQRVPVIFYISHLDRDLGVPVGAFGITNRPDELLHLVMDALERRA